MLKDKDCELAEDFAEIDALLEAWSREEAELPTELHGRIMGALGGVSPEKKMKEITKPKKVNNIYRYLAAAALAAAVILSSQAVGRIDLSGDARILSADSANYQKEVKQEENFGTNAELADFVEASRQTVALTAAPTGKEAAEVPNDAAQQQLTDDTSVMAKNTNALAFNNEAADTVSEEETQNALLSASFADEAVTDTMPTDTNSYLPHFSAVNGTENPSEIDWQKENEEKTALLQAEKTALHKTKDAAQKENIRLKIKWLDRCRHAISAKDAALYEELLLSSPYNE